MRTLARSRWLLGVPTLFLILALSGSPPEQGLGTPAAAFRWPPCDWCERAKRQWDQAVKQAQQNFQKFGEAVKKKWDEGVAAAKKFGEALKKKWDEGVAAAKKWAEDTRKKVEAGFAAARQWFEQKGKEAAKWWADRDREFREGVAKTRKWFEDRAEEFKKRAAEAWDWLQKHGKEIFCNILPGICPIIELVKGAATAVAYVGKYGLEKGVQKIWKDLILAKLTKAIERLKKKGEDTFAAFRSVLEVKDPRPGGDPGPLMAEVGKRCVEYVPTLMPRLKDLLYEINSLLGIPSFYNQVISWITAPVLSGISFTVMCPIAFIHHGTKKLAGFLLGQLIRGVGEIGAFLTELDKKAPGIKQLFDTLLSFATQAFPIATFFLKPEVKDKLLKTFERIADVAGKIQAGIEGAMRVAQAAAGGDLEVLDQALQKHEKPSGDLSKDELKRMLNALVEAGGEMLWSQLIEPNLRKLTDKIVSAARGLLRVPRMTLTATTGTIPIGGGVLSTILGTAVDTLIDMAVGLLTDEILKEMKSLVDDVMKEVAASLERELTGTQAGQRAGTGFLELAKAVAQLAGQVKGALKAASGKIGGVMAPSISSALENALAFGVQNAEVRRLIGQAVGAVVGQVVEGVQGKRVSIFEALATVLRQVAAPLAGIVASPILHPSLQGVVRGAVQTLIEGFAKDGAVRGLAKSPGRFFSDLAVRLLEKVKEPLAELLLGSIQSPELRQAIASAVSNLIKYVTSRGPAALLQVDRLFVKVLSELREPLGMYLGQVAGDPRLGAVLEGGIAVVVSRLESRGFSALLQGGASGIAGLLGDLLVSVKQPLASYVLEKAGKPELRATVEKAIEAVAGKLRSGGIGDIAGFFKNLAANPFQVLGIQPG
jgi:hypothetical protein